MSEFDYAAHEARIRAMREAPAMSDQAFYLSLTTLADLPPALLAEAWRRLRASRNAESERCAVFTGLRLDGELLAAHPKTLALAWMILAGHQVRVLPPPVADLYPGVRRPDRSLGDAMARAAMQVPEPLAGALRAIGTVNGRPAVKGRPPARVICAI